MIKPLHELNPMAKGKVDHEEMNITCVADQSSSRNDLFELVWENGPTCKSLLPSQSPKGEDKNIGYAIANEANTTRMEKFENLSEVGLSQDLEEVMPWLNFEMDDSLPHEYSSDFLHDLSGVTINNLHSSKKFPLGAAAIKNYPPESKEVDLSGECSKEPLIDSQQVMEPKVVEHDAAVSMKSDDPTCKEDASKIDQTSIQVLDESGKEGHEAVKKNIELAVVTSSVGSGNGAKRCSENPNQKLKQKSLHTEDFEFHSEDAEEESVGVKKKARTRSGMGSKRNRSALVHNLSERRRRDRINERMRALQELIPNCNKVDKASMLDEAIEYLKTLQLQLQIMSMGSGLYMPRMMLPADYLHISPFSPIGFGMQMGMGYGMGMPQVNGGSSRFPMAHLPQVQGTHLPLPNMTSQVTQNASDRGAVDSGKEDNVVIDKSHE